MKRLYILLTALFIITVGCSSGSNTPLTPQENSSADAMENIPVMGMSLHEDGSFNALGMFGAYELRINPENLTAELIAKRTSAIGESYVVSGKSYFTISPCATCLKIKSIELDVDGNVIVDFFIRHPFEKGDSLKPPSAINRLDLDVFDLALIVAPQETIAATYSQTGISAYNEICVNAHGYTTELNEVIEDSAALPYFLVIDDSIGGTGTYNKFAMGTKDFEFDATFSLASGDLNFDLYMTMGYGWSAKKPDRLNPQYYNPEFNRKAAWKVDVTPPEGANQPEMGNTWDDSDNSTAYDVTVRIYDWQIGANVDPELTNLTDIYSASGVSNVSVEIPGMNSALQSVTTEDSGVGTPGDPLVYTVSIPNENLLLEGEYFGLVKVTDERAVGTIGDRDFIIDSPDGVLLENFDLPEFATYQTFAATVVSGMGITLTSPNGGEEWLISSHHDITWDTVNNTGNIKLEYSKDGFVADINEIIASTEDDSVFDWQIPDDESETVRVRATLVDAPAKYDDSDADFAIAPVPYYWVFDDIITFTGVYNSPEMEDISPALCEEADGDIALTWASDDTYNLYPNGSYWWVRRSVDNGVTYGYQSCCDSASDGLHRGDRNKIVPGNQNDAWATSDFSNACNYIRQVENGPNTFSSCIAYPSYNQDIVVDATGYIYSIYDRWDNTLVTKHSQAPYNMTPMYWLNYPSIYPEHNIAPSARCSHVRSTGLDSSDVVWIAYFNNSETQISLAHSTGASPHEAWDSSTNVYSAGAGISQVKNPGLFIESDDTFHICYTRYDSTSSNYQLVYTSDDSSFSNPTEQVIAEYASEINDAHISVGSKFSHEVIVFMYENDESIWLNTLVGGAPIGAAEEIDNNIDDIDPDVILDADQCDLHSVWSTMDGDNYDIARRNGVLTQG